MYDTYVVTRDEMWNDHNYHVCTSYLVNGIQIQFDAFRFVSLLNVSKEIGENSFPTFSQVVKGFSGIAISRKFLPRGYTPFEIVFDSIRSTISANRNKSASGDVVDGSYLRVQMMLFQVNSFYDDACASGDTNTDRRCLMRANGIIRVHIAST